MSIMNITCPETVLNSSSNSKDSFIPVDSRPVFELAVTLCQICYPLIIAVGTFGNVMSIVIMSRMTSGDTTVNTFFIVIAIGDLLVLCTGTLPHWLEVTWDVALMTRWPVLHHVLRWIVSSSGATVNWLLVSVTLQRALSVVWPHHVHHLCSHRRVVSLIVGLTMFMAALYFPHLLKLFFTDNISPHVDCSVESSSSSSSSSATDFDEFMNGAFSYVDLLVFSLLPFMCLFLGNAVLASKLVISTRRARGILTAGTGAGSGALATTSGQMEQRERAGRSVTITVIVVSLTFIVLTSPPCVYFTFFNPHGFQTMSAGEYLFSTVSLLMADTNSAINFYLYCLTGHRFRTEFVSIMCCRDRGNPPGPKTSRAVSSVSSPPQKAH